MARKRNHPPGGVQSAALGSSEHSPRQGAAPSERKVADISVLELMEVLKIASPRAVQTAQLAIYAETKVVDLKVSDLLLLFTMR